MLWVCVCFALSVLFAFFDGSTAVRLPAAEHRRLPWWRAYSAWDDIARTLAKMDDVWQGNLTFAGIVLEAALVGVGALLFFGDRFGWGPVARHDLGTNTKRLLGNVWWVLPAVLLGTWFVLLTVRMWVNEFLNYFGLPRSRLALGGAVGAGLVLSLWYYPALAAQMSPKSALLSYAKLRGAEEPLGVVNGEVRSAFFYTEHGADRTLGDVSQAFAWLMGDDEVPGGRRWLVVRAQSVAEFNALYRRRALEPSDEERTDDHNLPVLDARSGGFRLVSNRLGRGERNENGFASLVGTRVPEPGHPLRANLDDQLEALGWDLLDGQTEAPVRWAIAGRRYLVRFYYKVLSPVRGDWQGFVHIDGYGRRHNGDHPLLGGRYPVGLWQPDDVVTDTYELQLEPNFAPGVYALYYGLFSGETRMPVRSGRHHENRIEGGVLRVR